MLKITYKVKSQNFSICMRWSFFFLSLKTETTQLWQAWNYVDHAGLKFGSACICLPRAGTVGFHHHIQMSLFMDKFPETASRSMALNEI